PRLRGITARRHAQSARALSVVRLFDVNAGRRDQYSAGHAMTANTKSMLLLALTLITGFSLGLFADASLVRGRHDRIQELRRPPGFVAHMEDVIQPRSGAQRDSIRPILERVARQNNQAIRDLNVRLRAALD